ncbi:MAG TPA: CHAT domain-containing protein [Mycobacteriales bacterium]
MTGPHRLVFELSDSIAPDGTPLVEIALKEPRVWGSPRQPFPYRGTEPVFLGLATAPPADAALRTVGRTLYDAVAARPPLADTFAEALRVQPPARYPLFVEIDSASQVESLPWEALCGQDGTFLGLDERWAIGRMIDAARPPATPRDLELPVKVAAVLSALHVPAGSEWQALWDAVGTVPDLPVELLVLASEDDLAETIAAVTPPAGVTVTVEQVPDSTEGLQQRIRAFNPHLLHFFCHGSAGRRQPYLQVAVRSDWVTATAHSLYLEAAQFRDLTERTSDRPWLLVLNCCESAAAGPRDNLQSLALMLVRDAALPAVVGMREPVSSTDASTFTRAFYTALLSEVDGRRAGTVPADEPLNWARYAVRARTTLLDRHPMPRTEAAESTREWTLPVVYLRPDPFVITVPAAPPVLSPVPAPVPAPAPSLLPPPPASAPPPATGGPQPADAPFATGGPQPADAPLPADPPLPADAPLPADGPQPVGGPLPADTPQPADTPRPADDAHPADDAPLAEDGARPEGAPAGGAGPDDPPLPGDAPLADGGAGPDGAAAGAPLPADAPQPADGAGPDGGGGRGGGGPAPSRAERPRAPRPTAAPSGGRPSPAGEEGDDGEAARSARLEADLLHGLLTRLPPGTPADLIADIRTRLAALGAPVPP